MCFYQCHSSCTCLYAKVQNQINVAFFISQLFTPFLKDHWFCTLWVISGLVSLQSPLILECLFTMKAGVVGGKILHGIHQPGLGLVAFGCQMMHPLFMCPKVEPCPEGLWAQVTMVHGPGIPVPPHVLIQVPFPLECQRTLVACKRPKVFMNQRVTLQVFLLPKSLFEQGAGKLSSFCVHQHVPLEGARVAECLLALLALVQVLFAFPMFQLVNFEAGFIDEGCLAHLAFEIICSFIITPNANY